MSYEHEEHLASSLARPAARDHAGAPGQATRSALLRKPDHAVASGLVQRTARDAGGGADDRDEHGNPKQNDAKANDPTKANAPIRASSEHRDGSGTQAYQGGAARAVSAPRPMPTGAEKVDAHIDVRPRAAGHGAGTNTHGGSPHDAQGGAHHVVHEQGGHGEGITNDDEEVAPSNTPEEVTGAHIRSAKPAEAAKRIQQAASTQKREIHALAQTEQRTVVSEAKAKRKAIRQAGADKVADILASIDRKQTAMAAEFGQARSEVKAKTAVQRQTAQADGKKALADLRKLITDKRQAAKGGAEKEAKALETTGKTEADRARKETATTVAAIQSAASSAYGAAGGDANAQVAVHNAIDEAKSDTLGKTQQQGVEVENKATSDANNAAQKIREGGDKLSSEVGDRSADVEKAIDDATKATVDRITAIEKTNLKQLDELEKKSFDALARMSGKVAGPIRSAANREGKEVQQAGKKTAKAVNAAAAAQSQAIDSAAREACCKLGDLPQDGEVDDAKLEQAVDAITGSFTEIHREGASAVTAESAKIKTNLGQVQQEFTANLTTTASKIEADISKAVSGANQAVAQMKSKVDEDTRQALDEMREGHKKAITDYSIQLQQKIDEGNKGWAKKREESETSIRDDVTKGLKGVIDLRSQAGPKFQDVAKNAMKKAEAESGIWEALTNFVGELPKFLTWVIIVAIFALAFVSGIAAAIAIALVIVGVSFLIVGFFSSLVTRWGQLTERLKSGKDSWYATLGLGALTVLASAGDAIGLTPLVEGIVGYDAVSWESLSTKECWKRGTEGALTLLTFGLFMFRARLKSGGKSGESGAHGTDSAGTNTHSTDTGTGPEPQSKPKTVATKTVATPDGELPAPNAQNTKPPDSQPPKVTDPTPTDPQPSTKPEIASDKLPPDSPEAVTTKATDSTSQGRLLKGTVEHRAARWEEYQQRDGKWSYERWLKVYEDNMTRAEKATAVVNAYRDKLGWGEREQTVYVEGVLRRLDIADVPARRAVEVKTGAQYATQDNLWEIARDEILIKKLGWNIRWHFEGTASKPLQDALRTAGIPFD